MSQTSIDQHVDNALLHLQYWVRNLSNEQLMELANNPAKINEQCKGSPVLNMLVTQRDGLKRVAKSYAEHSLEYEQRFYSTKSNLRDAHIEARRLKSECEKLKAELEAIGESRRIDKVANILRASVRVTEDESEVMMDQFLDGNMEMTEFLDKYTEKRKKVHEKEFKSKKLDEILKMQHI
ncbi:unnamed protein product [Bursaphelenchus okinawaensis]|uniref:VPS37 C-terminal domain-containing protein n=1 Tax=Bursaphelenchus okinawaensis TaxID=465554 RepID=A0A811KCX6_9BILA|nr:unnamed protein product [Bursaphelenchus okinawaensis]CAG9101262.1 unnamed protein product [Bursaphelenchus okinawaensis]